MWNSTRNFFNSINFLKTIYTLADKCVQGQCIQSHQFDDFRVAFWEEKLEYNLSMLTINIINYKQKRTTKAFAFVVFIFCKSFIISNISIFEDHNIKQIDIDITDFHCSD